MAVRLVVNPSPAPDNGTVEPAFYEILETPRSLRQVNATIQAQIILDEDTENEFEIEDVMVNVVTNQPNVRIIRENENTVRILGIYFDPFQDIFTFVERGSSDKLEQPKTVIGITNLPAQKDYYILEQDTREKTTILYNVTVVYKDTLTEELFTEEYDLIHNIINDFEGMRSFISEYYT